MILSQDLLEQPQLAFLTFACFVLIPVFFFLLAVCHLCLLFFWSFFFLNCLGNLLPFFLFFEFSTFLFCVSHKFEHYVYLYIYLYMECFVTCRGAFPSFFPLSFLISKSLFLFNIQCCIFFFSLFLCFWLHVLFVF